MLKHRNLSSVSRGRFSWCTCLPKSTYAFIACEALGLLDEERKQTLYIRKSAPLARVRIFQRSTPHDVPFFRDTPQTEQEGHVAWRLIAGNFRLQPTPNGPLPLPVL